MKLRYYQEEATQAIFNYFYSGKIGNPAIALPTGTGKSVIIADFIYKSLMYWPDQRFLVLTHVKELLSQNADKLRKIWPNAPIGIYSAGLGQKELGFPITFAGIASINGNVSDFGIINIVIIDECHMVSIKESSMYQKVISELKIKNPHLRIIGLSATPFRLGQGMITDNGLFTDICYDQTTLGGFNRLIKEGFLSTLIPKKTSIELDIQNVGIANGEYKQHDLQLAVDIDKITYSAVKELIEHGYSRHCGLVFTTGIEHCEHVTNAIQSFGETACCVHSKMPTKIRDKNLEDFKTGIYKYIVSNGVLTTGFDHPPIDIIGMLRPTLSPGLWVQMLGRGTRPYSWYVENQYVPNFNFVKKNCLVLDFAGNTKRLGPINDPVKPRKKGQKVGDAPIRICNQCGVYHHASVRICDMCGFVFPIKSKLTCEASTAELVKSDFPIIEWFNISRVIYHKHIKPGSNPVMRVTYYSGLQKFEEYVCFEHSGFARKRAIEWWQQRHSGQAPITVDSAIEQITQLKTPTRIKVQTNKKHPEVLYHEY